MLTDLPTALMDAPDVQAFLRRIGLAPLAGTVVIMDVDLARNAYVHPGNVPAAAVAYTVADPTFGRGRFPRLTLLELVERCSRLDGDAQRALAAVAGVRSIVPAREREAAFGPLAWDVVERFGLEGLFCEAPSFRPRPSHHALRPRGYDWGAPSQPEIPGALSQWRKLYKGLPRVRQVMAATVLTLYRGRIDNTWLKGVRKDLLAADAVDALRNDGALAVWAELVVLYPGW
jgi:hypothetical protein